MLSQSNYQAIILYLQLISNVVALAAKGILKSIDEMSTIDEMQQSLESAKSNVQHLARANKFAYNPRSHTHPEHTLYLGNSSGVNYIFVASLETNDIRVRACIVNF